MAKRPRAKGFLIIYVVSWLDCIEVCAQIEGFGQ